MLDGPWQVSSGIWNERPHLVRLRSNANEFRDAGNFDSLLSVVWNYGDDGKSGMPPTKVDDELDAFEERLQSTLELDDHAILVAVTTTAGMMIWHFYSSDLRESQTRVNSAFAHEPRRPLTLHGSREPEWATYEFLITEFGESDRDD